MTMLDTLKSKILVGSGTAVGIFGTALPAFATEGTVTPYVLTASALAPLTTAINSNVPIIVPVAIGVMGIMIGISLIPKIIYKFF